MVWLREKIKPAVERREAIVARSDANWSFGREDDKEKKGKLTASKKKLPGVAKTTGNAYVSAARRVLKAAEWAPNDPGAQLGSVKLDDLRRNGSAATLTAYYDARLKQQVRQNGGGLVTVENEKGAVSEDGAREAARCLETRQVRCLHLPAPGGSALLAGPAPGALVRIVPSGERVAHITPDDLSIRSALAERVALHVVPTDGAAGIDLGGAILVDGPGRVADLLTLAAAGADQQPWPGKR